MPEDCNQVEHVPERCCLQLSQGTALSEWIPRPHCRDVINRESHRKTILLPRINDEIYRMRSIIVDAEVLLHLQGVLPGVISV